MDYYLVLKEGRFISVLDQKQPHVVVAQRVLTRPGFKDFKDPLLGRQVKINRHIYTIIGVLENVPDPLFGPRGINWAFIMLYCFQGKHSISYTTPKTDLINNECRKNAKM